MVKLSLILQLLLVAAKMLPSTAAVIEGRVNWGAVLGFLVDGVTTCLVDGETAACHQKCQQVMNAVTKKCYCNGNCEWNDASQAPICKCLKPSCECGLTPDPSQGTSTGESQTTLALTEKPTQELTTRFESSSTGVITSALVDEPTSDSTTESTSAESVTPFISPACKHVLPVNQSSPVTLESLMYLSDSKESCGCEWILRAPEGRRLKINTFFFEVLDDDSLTRTVVVRDFDLPYNEYGKFKGSNGPNLISTKNNVVITVNHFDRKSDFILEISVVD